MAQTPEHLPATIETIEGVYGFGQQFTISAGDKLHVHFAKSVQMAVLCDRGGTQFHVPLSSAMKFGLCQQDEEFEKVSDIVKKSQHLPHVICCQQHVPRRGKQEEVKKDELLIVKKYDRALTCQSLWSDREIMLHKNCKGSFSSTPEKTSMYLLDIRQHLPHVIPRKVYLYPPVPRKKHDLFTRGKVFTLKEFTTVTSLVVSNIDDEELFDIILDETLSTLRVTVLGKAPAMSLSRKFSIMPGQYTKLMKRDVSSGFQEALYTTLRRGFESEGVQLAAGGSGSSDVSGGRGDYEYVDVVPARHYYSAGEFSHVPPQSPAEQNRDYLKSLSMHEISLLLKAMNLEKYQATFSKEQVSGSLLAEFNDHNLQRYLHIHNPCHRQKLLQVISGETAAEKLLFSC
ncbi:hypothetical protein GBAR_LOCUS25916 [Geodia barretti]|uniref:SAM domain-containing protein n=1 Tax=Geodia barretti TaxID=519541 RepID=A0AA35TFP6_GEOBA|nr:hypothetical protein GBAR_LOCUS25916 [Geodia barretti]